MSPAATPHSPAPTEKATTSKTPTGGNSSSTAIEFEPPLACVRRILKHALPSSTNVGKDASAAFARACGIFVIYVTACANDFARENKRQTITANDVLAAVKELDFDDFTPQLTAFLDRYRRTEKTKRETKAAAKAADEQESAKRQKLNNSKANKVVKEEGKDDDEEDDDDDDDDKGEDDTKGEEDDKGEEDTKGDDDTKGEEAAEPVEEAEEADDE